MSFLDIGSLSDKGLLTLYGRAKTNFMLARLFRTIEIPQEMYDLLHQVNQEITKRGLDRRKTNAAE